MLAHDNVKRPARPTLFGLDECADYLGISVKTLRRRIADGSIPAYRVANTRQIRVKQSDLDRLLQRIPTTAA
jgi:excisionase family DNA binding protein